MRYVRCEVGDGASTVVGVGIYIVGVGVCVCGVGVCGVGIFVVGVGDIA